MIDEIPYKYKYIVNKIMNCIVQYISNNLSKNLLIESKLLLLNNYIIDIFNPTEAQLNTKINIKINKDHAPKILLDKSVSSNIITSKYDNKVSFNKLRHLIFNSGNQIIKENSPKSNNEKYKNKDKFKIIKLEKLLKCDSGKNKIKELPHLKGISLMQERWNFNDVNKEIQDKPKNSVDIERKNNSYIFDEEKLKAKINNNSISLKHNFDYFYLMNSPKNNKINFFCPNNRIIKHRSVSQMNLLRKDINSKNNHLFN